MSHAGVGLLPLRLVIVQALLHLVDIVYDSVPDQVNVQIVEQAFREVLAVHVARSVLLPHSTTHIDGCISFHLKVGVSG